MRWVLGKRGIDAATEMRLVWMLLLPRVAMSGAEDVKMAVSAAEAAFAGWSAQTAKSRAAVMFRFHALLEKHADELVRASP